MADKTPDPLYSISDVAEYLRVTPRTVRRWVHDGAITAYRFGRQWRFKSSDFQEFAEKHRKACRFDVR